MSSAFGKSTTLVAGIGRALVEAKVLQTRLEDLLEAEDSRLVSAERAALEYCRVSCALHLFDPREDTHMATELKLPLAEFVRDCSAHYLAKYPREGPTWDARPIACAGRSYLWQLLLPALSEEEKLHITVILETDECAATEDQSEAPLLSRLSSLSPDDWWACACRTEDLPACREALSRGLCCGRRSRSSSRSVAEGPDTAA